MKKYLVALCAALTLACTLVRAGEINDIASARAVAETWLQLVDAGLYDRGWQESSRFFRGDYSQERFEAILKDLRSPLGGLILREEISAAVLQTPDGDCVSLRFFSQFEKDDSVLEFVELLREKDRSWRVSLWSFRHDQRPPAK